MTQWNTLMLDTPLYVECFDIAEESSKEICVTWRHMLLNLIGFTFQKKILSLLKIPIFVVVEFSTISKSYAYVILWYRSPSRTFDLWQGTNRNLDLGVRRWVMTNERNWIWKLEDWSKVKEFLFLSMKTCLMSYEKRALLDMLIITCKNVGINLNSKIKQM